ETITNYAVEIGLAGKFSPLKLITYLLVLAFLGIVGILILNRSRNKFAIKVRECFLGMYEGLKTILTMNDKWLYIAHTLFIWVLYLAMFYVTFFSLSSVENVPFTGVVTAFVMGGIAVTVTNGGIGAYPLAIAGVLALYGVTHSQGYAFGWVVWTGQTIMLIL